MLVTTPGDCDQFARCYLNELVMTSLPQVKSSSSCKVEWQPSITIWVKLTSESWTRYRSESWKTSTVLLSFLVGKMGSNYLSTFRFWKKQYFLFKFILKWPYVNSIFCLMFNVQNYIKLLQNKIKDLENVCLIYNLKLNKSCLLKTFSLKTILKDRLLCARCAQETG